MTRNAIEALFEFVRTTPGMEDTNRQAKLAKVLEFEIKKASGKGEVITAERMIKLCNRFDTLFAKDTASAGA